MSARCRHLGLFVCDWSLNAQDRFAEGDAGCVPGNDAGSHGLFEEI